MCICSTPQLGGGWSTDALAADLKAAFAKRDGECRIKKLPLFEEE
ncbi:hypothetical protein EMEDMD4_530080 [Sinorhizobium medicae]|uniref:Uncharacterized protein n=1 Tax=Sinorhizobium medicae TaxID=110321 RepID=A0A508X7P7_9HYPH|nr:hypothetical protein EMEDMD4_530080 [Sinorhizobium medicae]